MRIDIIGAGPAGTFLARILADKGHSVKIFERDATVGKPVQCTGILSDYFLNFMDPTDEFVLSTVDKARIYAPNGKFVDAKIKKNYVICRKKFDSYLAKKAQESGAALHLEHSFQSYMMKGKKIHSKIISRKRTLVSVSDVLIGADGPLSQVAKSAGLFKDRDFLIGTQIEAKKKNDGVVEFYPFVGSYAWIVPVDNKTVRIGVASRKDSVPIFRKFAKERLGEYSSLTLENQSGVIPLFDPGVNVQNGSVYLIGDAATFNKATSGGGINQALKAGIILADCIERQKNYNFEWKKHMYIELLVHYKLHKIMQKFKDDDWNELIRVFREPKMKKILYGESRDNLVRMCIRIGLAKPSLIRFIKYLI